MRLALVARAALATTIALTYFSLAESVNAQEILQKDKNFFSLPYQSSNSDLRNKQRYDYDRDRYDRDRYDRNRYDRDRYDRDRYDGGRRSQYDDEINRLYRQVLGRNADYDGLRTWSRELQRGRSLSYIRRELAYSQEAENTINNIYRRVLGRNVDRNGLRTWQSELARGKSLREVERSIERSPEARNRR
ncbi:DUF4214 domain-containing protein [Aerosakkonemataceae cyanobacterium BLCC-F50]|uniref:DUF4214 domain-containing protein n=1 Tax=Floridaenema flaviceps BLCC-F50 TaxID=3153642 RepID=A0ABV4XXG4_9CYAN